MSSCQSCNQDNPLVAAFVDSDGDGWYDENRNQRIDLFIDSVDNNSGTMFGGRPAIAIDDRIVAFSNQSVPTDVPVATRTIGNWGAPERTDAFGANLRLTNQIDISSATPTRITFQNLNATFTASVSGFVVRFRTVRTLFPDPSPNDANADNDADGLTDKEEASIHTQTARSAGSPLDKDILLVVGFTHPDWKLTQKSIDLLTTVFFDRRRINLTIFTQEDRALGLTPGQIRIDGEVPARDHRLSLAEGRAVRSQLAASDLSEFGVDANLDMSLLFHVLVLAEHLANDDWGRAEAGSAANDLVCRSHLPFLGPDHFEYQAKDVMHELGHNLGLCHPPLSDSTCPTGSIPQAERNGGQSAMGTPAEAAGPVEVMIEALSRPLDYTPGQWANMDLRRLR